MFRVDQFIAVCSALIAFGTTASAATPETRRNEDVPSVMVSAPTEGREIVQISDLQPFTHIAYIPVDSDLSSIKVERIDVPRVTDWAPLDLSGTRGNGEVDVVLAGDAYEDHWIEVIRVKNGSARTMFSGLGYLSVFVP